MWPVQVCGLCLSGWAKTAKGCSPCPDESDLISLRKIAIAAFVISGFVVWYLISWRHMFESTLECFGLQSPSNVEEVYNLAKKGKKYYDDLIKFKERLKNQKDSVIQYSKLYISFFQILASFLTFNVKWPYLLMSFMTWVNGIVFLDILQLPALGCLWNNVNFQQRLLTYTLAP
jgi:hypothetical protein